jgi:hypothetical protein
MTYNFTAGKGYHTKHFNDLHNIRANTCGYIATHMFAEYLSKMKNLKYIDALDDIASADDLIEISDWYIGAAFCNLAWRQAAVYRDRCTEGDWLKSFNDIFDEKGQETVNKDYIQLRMCAYLLSLYLDNKMRSLKLKVINETSVNKHGERLVAINDFPEIMQEFVIHIKNKHAIQGGGRQRKNASKNS